LNRPAALPAARRQLLGGTWIRHRNLLGELVRRDLKSRYRGSRLGILWSLFNPLVFMVIYSVVFSQFMRFGVSGGAPYPVYLLSGLLCWNFLAQALTGSVHSILGNASIVKKVAFPWVLLTLSAVLAALLLAFPTSAFADTLIDNIDGISVDRQAHVTHFAAMVIDDHGRVAQVWG